MSLGRRMLGASVLHADSVRKKAEHTDTSSEGVKLGDFDMPFKHVELPSDIEILSEPECRLSL